MDDFIGTVLAVPFCPIPFCPLPLCLKPPTIHSQFVFCVKQCTENEAPPAAGGRTHFQPKQRPPLHRWRCLQGQWTKYSIHTLLRPILLSSVAPYKVHGALAPSVPPFKVFSVYHLHAPPPGRNVPLQWLVPQFGMASLCLSAHSLELFLRHSFLNLRRFYLVVLGLGAPLSSPT